MSKTQTLDLASGSEDETIALARSIGPHLEAGDVISLTGDLGAGKTHFAKGLASGLGIQETIVSPTFTIIKQYAGRLPLYHFDVFRLKKPEELIDLGYEDYFFGDGVTLVEWGDKIADYLPSDHLAIDLRHDRTDPNTRALSIKAGGPRARDLLKRLVQFK